MATRPPALAAAIDAPHALVAAAWTRTCGAARGGYDAAWTTSVSSELGRLIPDESALNYVCQFGAGRYRPCTNKAAAAEL
jgi:hypothetical protein